MTAPIHGATARCTTTSPPPPLPARYACPSIDDLLLFAQLDDRKAGELRATGEAEVHGEARTFAIADARAAEARAKEAEESAGKWSGFLGTMSTVATVAAVVAAAASVVVTGGCSAPIALAVAGTLLSASAPAVKQTLGDDAGSVALWGGIAMSLGGGGWSLAAGGATASAGSTGAKALAAWVGTGARAAEGSARVAQGAAQVKEKSLEAQSIEERANVLERSAAARREQVELEQVARHLGDLEASVRRAITTVVAIDDRIQQTRAGLIAGVGRSLQA